MVKGALIVGINNYGEPRMNLQAPVNDAKALAEVLGSGDVVEDFDVELRTDIQTKSELMSEIVQLFKEDIDTALFYFSGHGCMNERGGFIITPDFDLYDEGISMDHILNIVNFSTIKNRIVILDCCHAGGWGSPANHGSSISFLAEGVTILASSRKSEASIEVNGHSVFTDLLLNALQGGAADIAGHITPGSIYSFIDRTMGFFQQRPVFKTNISRFISLRNVEPLISRATLRKLTQYFPAPQHEYSLDPSYEETNKGGCCYESFAPYADPQHVAVFKDLQKMQSLGLIAPVGAPYMFFAAMESKSCRLTELGKHYWTLINRRRTR